MSLVSFAHPNVHRAMNTQSDTKRWIAAIAQHLQLSASELARRAGLATSTITRYLNDQTGAIGISQRSLDAISQYSGFLPHQMPGAARAHGFSEPEAVPYSYDATEVRPEWLDGAVAAVIGDATHKAAWVMKSSALDMIGIMPRDIMVIDMNRSPSAKDIVCVQITDFATGSAETLFRYYDAPFAVARSAKLGHIKPLLVDNEAIQIRGVVVASFREQH